MTNEEKAREVVKWFVLGTPSWYESLSDEQKRAPMCLMCGIIPANLVQLSEALKVLSL